MRNKIFKIGALAAAAVVLSACGGGDDEGGGVPVVGRDGTVEVGSVNMPGDQTCNIPGFAQALVAEINAARAQARNCGAFARPAVPPIPYWNTLLSEAARMHSADMANNNFFSHSGSDGSDHGDRADKAGYKYGVRSEIIAGVAGSIPAVVNAWLNSPSHCGAIMEEPIKLMGAACVSGPGQYRNYWTVLFSEHR